jgi:hypothetical protein
VVQLDLAWLKRQRRLVGDARFCQAIQADNSSELDAHLDQVDEPPTE